MLNVTQLSGFGVKPFLRKDGGALLDSVTGANATPIDITRFEAGVAFTPSSALKLVGGAVLVHTVTTSGDFKMHLYAQGSSTKLATMASAQTVFATGRNEFTFDASYTLTPSTQYVLVLERTSGELILSTVTDPGTDIDWSGVQGGVLYSQTTDSNMDAGEDFAMGWIYEG